MRSECRQTVLPSRLELKYLVPRERLAELRSELLPFFEIDSFARQAGIEEYTVRSVYYDTVGFDNYYEKMDGIKVRKKLRIRGYGEPNEQSLVFLEIKRKNKDFISKNRFPVKYSQLDEFLQSRKVAYFASFQNSTSKLVDDGKRFFYNLIRHSMRPVILISYDREAFFCKFKDAIRVTLDKNIRSRPFPGLSNLYDENDLLLALPNHFVLEVKFFGGFPTWIRDIITRFRLKQTSVSKYTICLDSHRMLGPILERNCIGMGPSFFQNVKNQMEVYPSC